MDRSNVGLAEPIEADEGFYFEATYVTGTHDTSVTDVSRSMPAGQVAQAVAARMSLPATVSYAFHDKRGAVLADDQPLAEQLQPGERVTLAPKTHLG